MMLIEDTPVPDAALPVEAFKAHLRLGSGFGPDDVQDAVIRSFLRAAMAAIETRTGKALMARMFTLTRSDWADRMGQVLPIAPVQAVVSVTVVDADDGETLVEAAAYRLERDSQCPQLRPKGGLLAAVPTGGQVRVRFEAGLGFDWASVPADMQQAVLMLAAHYYEYRNDTALSDGCMPFGVSSLIERYKTVRMGFGAGQ